MRLRSHFSATLLMLVVACSEGDPAATALSQDGNAVANAEAGGFSYQITTLCQRTKPAPSAPPGYAATWTETIEMIEAADPKDADFSRFMRDQAMRLRREYYQLFGEPTSFETNRQAGWMDVTADVIAASPDLVSVSIGTAYYEAGMAHPESKGERLIWSRRLHRLLTQDDVLAIAPDRALRRVALARFDNRDNLQRPDDADGIPLTWDHASIGPDDITWSFDPYELGGYLSSGSTTVGWPVLKPYLRRDLPFAVGTIRQSSYTDRKKQMPTECV
jgi:hypothetical protein